MVKLIDVLNKRFSTRNLSDADFDAGALHDTALELAQENYYIPTIFTTLIHR
jgi:hypothetical protein